MTRSETLIQMQDPADEHDWVRWFDDPRNYRGMVFDYKEEKWRSESTIR